MKKALLAMVLLTAAILYGQDTYSIETDHYAIESHISESNAQLMGNQMESFYSVFNDVFRFADLDYKLNVQVLPNISTFESYTGTLTGSSYNNYVYIHYPKDKERVLLVYEGAEEDLIFALVYQASIQFIMNHVPNPPLWIREGFSVYFSRSSGPDLERKFASLKNSDDRISVEKLLLMSSEEAEEDFNDFRTEAWAFITFLMNTENKEYTRFLYDTISSLTNDALGEVTASSDIQRGYDSYLQGFLNARELMSLGIDSYSSGEKNQAKQSFTKLLEISPDSWQPLYFLGLIAYDEGEYTEADSWYGKSDEKGAPEALTAYVTGLTAWKDERIAEAKGLLTKAARLDEEKYGEKTADLLEYLEGNYPDTAPVNIP